MFWVTFSIDQKSFVYLPDKINLHCYRSELCALLSILYNFVLPIQSSKIVNRNQPKYNFHRIQ